MCYTDKAHTRKNWSNDMEGRIAFLDKYACEDALKFQSIEFDVLDGYYFDEGFNPMIKKTHPRGIRQTQGRERRDGEM